MVTRIMVEKRATFDVEAQQMCSDIKSTLHIEALSGLRIINCYDIEGLHSEDLKRVTQTILSEVNVDLVRTGEWLPAHGEHGFRMAFLPGQYDQRADSALQCIQIVTLKDKPQMETSKIIVLKGALTEEDKSRIKAYLINPVESHEVPMGLPMHIGMRFERPSDVAVVEGFTQWSDEALLAYKGEMGFAMTEADIRFVRRYFKEEVLRNPTVTELKVIDTYWSDHCRHTTFMSQLKTIALPESGAIQDAFKCYKRLRDTVYPNGDRPFSLMDLATINMKALHKTGGLSDLDVSDEINACSINIDVTVKGKKEPWLLMFKNETHNHPTEIEPYGGAATCLGGAIRDPLSGRSYVYQSMRVSGAADPTAPIEETLEGKLPQKVITQKAAAGFSAYGNQIGLATGLVSEVYDPGFLAKRMEVGAVIAAAPKANVVRKKPVAGDVIVLVGGKTGRDGIGGATGSSKAHDEESIMACGAEVQKGNPPEERKIQRLFRKPELTKLIKKCNDFGAGGVSVAIGELADSLEITLDAVPKKYEGLDGTEIAISESQERMAVVLDPEDVEAFIGYCEEENLEATVVAKVTDSGRLVMTWRGQKVLDLSRAFLDTNGVRASAEVKVKAPEDTSFFDHFSYTSLQEALGDLNVCSQKGLVERFDNTIGSGTVLMPFGGKYERTPIQTMVAKIPVLEGDTDTVSMMSYGYDPEIGKWSPFHGGLYAVVDAISKIVASGGDYKKVRLSLQEYFEKLGEDPEKWGKPFAALLGASYAQDALKTAAIGGKDSMSGTFKNLNVPPTLIAFAVASGEANAIISPEFKNPHANVYTLYAKRSSEDVVDFEALTKGYEAVHKGILSGDILSAYAVGRGGLGVCVAKMGFGNGIGIHLEAMDQKTLFEPAFGSIVFEMKPGHTWADTSLSNVKLVGRTVPAPEIKHLGMVTPFDALLSAWEKPLEAIFPVAHKEKGKTVTHRFDVRGAKTAMIKTAKPRVLVPVFPGTNCEYDTIRAFENAGASTETLVFRNRSSDDILWSIEALAEKINRAQMIALPGGFSAGDEPEGSGKFIASVLRNPEVAQAVMKLLNERDGLMLGICNGFQALVKLGLLPYGDIRPLTEDAPTLTFNAINRHVARMAKVRVASVMSPWMALTPIDAVYQTAFSHGEGRFFASDSVIETLAKNGQIATQYVDDDSEATMEGRYNLNGSVHAIEGITSPDGRIFGKMGHVERVGKHLYKNIVGEKEFEIFKAGVKYFK